MPPKGLYPMPRQHRFSRGTPVRTIYNSNHFREKESPAKSGQEKSKKVVTAGDGEAPEYKQLGGSVEETPKATEDREKRKKDKKEKKSRKKSLDPTTHADTPGEEREHGAVKTPQTEKKSKKKPSEDVEVSGEKRRSSSKKKKESHSQAEGVRSEPKKKRKRESELNTATPTVTRVNLNGGNLAVGEDLVRKVADAMDKQRTLMLSSMQAPTEVDSPKKKKRKSDGDKQTVQAEAVPIPSKSPKKNKVKGTTAVEPHGDKTPTTAIKTKGTAQADVTSGPSKSLTQPISIKKTPVPLPQDNTRAPTSHPAQLNKDTVLVPETPPSQRSRSSNVAFNATPVLFKLYQPNATLAPPLSTPSFLSSGATPQSPPAAPVTTKKTPVPLPSVPNALTKTNLTRHTEPLNDEPKPKPRGKASSSAGSTASIKDMFARMGGKQRDPIVDSTPSKATTTTTHRTNELTVTTFNAQFAALQSSIDFAAELAHLEAYLTWDLAHADQELPCLGKATGCTSKKEELLRLRREENMPHHLVPSLSSADYNPATLTIAGTRAHNAEELLMLSVRAGIPIPIGRLEGVWTLYCPRYAASHFDRYGYGQRTLTVSRIAGFNDRHSYTARLKVPPRSMLYSVLAFQTPPHASFRAVPLQTSAEGYRMEVVFLGNGYLVLRADLRELLQGKRGEVGSAWMEFVGVHEEAVEWWGVGEEEEGEGEKERKEEKEGEGEMKVVEEGEVIPL